MGVPGTEDQDPAGISGARGNEVSLAAVDGVILLEDGRLTRVDEAEVLARAGEFPEEIGEGAPADFHRINGPNARFMETDRL